MVYIRDQIDKQLPSELQARVEESISGDFDGMFTPELRRHPGSPNAYSSARVPDWEMILPMITPETGGSCMDTFAFLPELQFHWMVIP